MAENIDNQCRAFHVFLGGNASKSVLVKQAFENAKEKQLKAYKQMASKDDFAFILYEPLGTEESDKQILELTGKDAFEAWGGGLCEAHLQNRCGFWAFRKQEQSRWD
ncbi:dihydrolipoamide acetyltransferase [Helicobacter pylori]|nr:dihydrolipoamide acetyltransferase [Helicobacter pylori]